MTQIRWWMLFGVLFLFSDSKCYRLKHGFVLGIDSWDVCTHFRCLEECGERGETGRKAAEPFGKERKVFCNFQSCDLLPYSEINYSLRSLERSGGGDNMTVHIWWKTQLLLLRKAAPSPAPWNKANGPSLWAVSWGQSTSNIWNIISIFSPYGSWGENHILDTAGIRGCSFKMKIYSQWSLVSAQGNLCWLIMCLIRSLIQAMKDGFVLRSSRARWRRRKKRGLEKWAVFISLESVALTSHQPSDLSATISPTSKNQRRPGLFANSLPYLLATQTMEVAFAKFTAKFFPRWTKDAASCSPPQCSVLGQ